MLPEATFLRMMRRRLQKSTPSRSTDTSATKTSFRKCSRTPSAHVTIYHGILTAYPNFIFRIDEKDVDEFAAKAG